MDQDTPSFDVDWFENAPCAMLLQDGQGRVQWTNRALEAATGATSDQLLGRDAAALGENELGPLLGDQDTVELVRADAPRRTLRHCVAEGPGGRRLHFFEDVSRETALAEENERLREQVAGLKLTDDLTGLPNRRAISQALEVQISRSRRYQNPLSVVMVMVTLQGQLGALPDPADGAYLAVSRFLRDRMRWVDQIGRWDDNVFILVLPETTIEDANGLVDKIRAESGGLSMPEPFTELTAEMTIGTACWAKGDDMRTLLQSALESLKTDT